MMHPNFAANSEPGGGGSTGSASTTPISERKLELLRELIEAFPSSRPQSLEKINDLCREHCNEQGLAAVLEVLKKRDSGEQYEGESVSRDTVFIDLIAGLAAIDSPAAATLLSKVDSFGELLQHGPITAARASKMLLAVAGSEKYADRFEATIETLQRYPKGAFSCLDNFLTALGTSNPIEAADIARVEFPTKSELLEIEVEGRGKVAQLDAGGRIKVTAGSTGQYMTGDVYHVFNPDNLDSVPYFCGIQNLKTIFGHWHPDQVRRGAWSKIDETDDKHAARLTDQIRNALLDELLDAPVPDNVEDFEDLPAEPDAEDGSAHEHYSRLLKRKQELLDALKAELQELRNERDIYRVSAKDIILPTGVSLQSLRVGMEESGNFLNRVRKMLESCAEDVPEHIEKAFLDLYSSQVELKPAGRSLRIRAVLAFLIRKSHIRTQTAVDGLKSDFQEYAAHYAAHVEEAEGTPDDYPFIRDFGAPASLLGRASDIVEREVASGEGDITWEDFQIVREECHRLLELRERANRGFFRTYEEEFHTALEVLGPLFVQADGRWFQDSRGTSVPLGRLKAMFEAKILTREDLKHIKTALELELVSSDEADFFRAMPITGRVTGADGEVLEGVGFQGTVQGVITAFRKVSFVLNELQLQRGAPTLAGADLQQRVAALQASAQTDTSGEFSLVSHAGVSALSADWDPALDFNDVGTELDDLALGRFRKKQFRPLEEFNATHEIDLQELLRRMEYITQMGLGREDTQEARQLWHAKGSTIREAAMAGIYLDNEDLETLHDAASKVPLIAPEAVGAEPESTLTRGLQLSVKLEAAREVLASPFVWGVKLKGDGFAQRPQALRSKLDQPFFTPKWEESVTALAALRDRVQELPEQYPGEMEDLATAFAEFRDDPYVGAGVSIFSGGILPTTIDLAARAGREAVSFPSNSFQVQTKRFNDAQKLVVELAQGDVTLEVYDPQVLDTAIKMLRNPEIMVRGDRLPDNWLEAAAFFSSFDAHDALKQVYWDCTDGGNRYLGTSKTATWKTFGETLAHLWKGGRSRFGGPPDLEHTYFSRPLVEAVLQLIERTGWEPSPAEEQAD